MENILKNYTYEVQVCNNEYLLLYRLKYYKIGKTIYSILLYAKESETLEILNKKLNNNYSINKLVEIINNYIMPILNKDQANNDCQFIKNYWWTGQLLKPEFASLMAKPFKVLFNARFPYIFILLSLLNIFWFIKNYKIIYSIPQDYETFQIIIVYLLLFIILLLHELGHIAASLSEKLKSKGIGFGFYFFMPMMYINLTDAWILSRSARIKINLAGITMQMLVNIVLFIILLFVENIFFIGIISKLLFVNTFIVLLNLIPYLKFDGYWILSDILNIPNLLKESNKNILSFFIKKSPFSPINEISKTKRQNIYLAIFTFSRLLFLITFIISIFMFVIYNILKSSYFIMSIPYIDINIDSSIDIFKHLILLSIVFIICKKYTISIYRFIRKKYNNGYTTSKQ